MTAADAGLQMRMSRTRIVEHGAVFELGAMLIHEVVSGECRRDSAQSHALLPMDGDSTKHGPYSHISPP